MDLIPATKVLLLHLLIIRQQLTESALFVRIFFGGCFEYSPNVYSKINLNTPMHLQKKRFKSKNKNFL